MAAKKEHQKRVLVDEKQFTALVKKLVDSPPIKREEIRVSKQKPHKLIPP